MAKCHSGGGGGRWLDRRTETAKLSVSGTDFSVWDEFDIRLLLGHFIWKSM